MHVGVDEAGDQETAVAVDDAGAQESRTGLFDDLAIVDKNGSTTKVCTVEDIDVGEDRFRRRERFVWQPEFAHAVDRTGNFGKIVRLTVEIAGYRVVDKQFWIANNSILKI